MLNSAGYE